MKIWVTRPCTWDLWVRGIGRCELWLQKPFFDTAPRGKERDPICPQFPVGWRVEDPIYGDITGQVRMTVHEAIPSGEFDEFAHSLWAALCRSVDGMGPDEQGGARRRIEALLDAGLDDDAENQVTSTFLFEYDAPPKLWFKVAWLNGVQRQTAEGRWAQKIFVLDTEMGIEADEPPPPKHKVIDFDQMSVVKYD